MKGLTEKQQRILDFIDEFGRRNEMAPTVYEVAEYFGIKPATAFAHLRALQRKGFIERSSKARSMTLVRGSKPKHLSTTLSIPLLGRISAGLPLFAEENREDTIQVDPAILPYGLGGHRLFALQINGDSMKDAGILDGDTVIAKESNTAEIGDIVVALVDGDEATIKYFYLSDDNKIELRPANKRFSPQIYDLDQVQIQGVVVSLFRRF